MDHFVIRMNSDEEKLIKYLKGIEKPYKLYVQRIYPKATPGQMKFLWGVVYKIISDHTGHSPIEIHEFYKNFFNIEYSPVPNSQGWDLRIKGASEFNTISIAMYTDMVKAHANIELGIGIPDPSEVWVDDNEDYNK